MLRSTQKTSFCGIHYFRKVAVSCTKVCLRVIEKQTNKIKKTHTRMHAHTHARAFGVLLLKKNTSKKLPLYLSQTEYCSGTKAFGPHSMSETFSRKLLFRIPFFLKVFNLSVSSDCRHCRDVVILHELIQGHIDVRATLQTFYRYKLTEGLPKHRIKIFCNSFVQKFFFQASFFFF